jgi:hypothetical protein
VGSVRRKTLILDYLAKTQPALIGEAQFGELRARFAPVSERNLRNLLRHSGIPLSPLVEGVRQESLDELARTLLSVLGEYEAAQLRNDKARARQCRALVIAAKDHARLALRKADPERRELKQEMILWMLTWLENPGLFPRWLELRKMAAEKR